MVWRHKGRGRPAQQSRAAVTTTPPWRTADKHGPTSFTQTLPGLPLLGRQTTRPINYQDYQDYHYWAGKLPDQQTTRSFTRPSNNKTYQLPDLLPTRHTTRPQPQSQGLPLLDLPTHHQTYQTYQLPHIMQPTSKQSCSSKCNITLVIVTAAVTTALLLYSSLQ